MGQSLNARLLNAATDAGGLGVSTPTLRSCPQLQVKAKFLPQNLRELAIPYAIGLLDTYEKYWFHVCP